MPAPQAHVPAPRPSSGPPRRVPSRLPENVSAFHPIAVPPPEQVGVIVPVAIPSPTDLGVDPK